MNMSHKRAILLVVLVELVAMAVVIRSSGHRGDDPALASQRIQQQLFEAQQALAGDPTTAEANVALAAAQHATLVPLLPPSAYVAAQAGGQALARARDAVAARDEPALAQARADYQTALYWAGYLATLESIRSGGANAEVWLKLRAYKPSARFNAAPSGATSALQDLAAGRIPAEVARDLVRRELDETYQVLLTDALEASASAAQRRFGVRAAEEAALAAGYFRILRPGFVAQAGERRATAADRALTDLRTAASQADWPSVVRARAAVAAALSE
jgi:high-affinity iron transporter